MREATRHPAHRRIRSGIRLLILDLGCCGASALQIGDPTYGLQGYDGNAYDLAPGQANVLVVAGRVPPQSVGLVQSFYNQLAPPKWVISYGVCAVSGVVFDTVSVGQCVPVDFAVGGCPPSTNMLWDILEHLPARRES